MNSSLSFAKVWFIISFAGLAFLYGTAVGKWEWFPYSILNDATDQARAVKESYFQPSAKLRPKVYERAGIRAPRPEAMQSGLTLIASQWEASGEWVNQLRLIDREGKTVHKWEIERRAVIPDSKASGFLRRWSASQSNIHGNYLFPNGDVLVNLEHIATARIDACGKVVWTLSEGNHHSIDRADDGSFWIPGVSSKKKSNSDMYPNGYPGIEKKVWIDKAVRVSEGGEVIKRINILDVIYKNGLKRYIPKKYEEINSVKEDITHINDIEQLSKKEAREYPLFDSEDIMVSVRNLDLIIVFDPTSLKVKWHSHSPFIRQHDPDFVGGGWVGVFDNNRDYTERGSMLGGSRIVLLQPHTDSVEAIFPTDQSDPFYTPIRGKWQKLSNGNMLLTESNAGRVVEVDPEGRTVWEWIQPVDGSQVPPVTKATRVELTRNEVASWSCSSVDSVSTPTQ